MSLIQQCSMVTLSPVLKGSSWWGSEDYMEWVRSGDRIRVSDTQSKHHAPVGLLVPAVEPTSESTVDIHSLAFNFTAALSPCLAFSVLDSKEDGPQGIRTILRMAFLSPGWPLSGGVISLFYWHPSMLSGIPVSALCCPLCPSQAVWPSAPSVRSPYPQCQAFLLGRRRNVTFCAAS